jgi:hypothetical protein
MKSNLRYDVDKAYPGQISQFLLDVTKQVDEIKEKASRDDISGIYDNLEVINLTLYGLLNEKFELAERSASYIN